MDTAPTTRSHRPSAVVIQGMELCCGALDHQLCLLARDALVCSIPKFTYPPLSLICTGYRLRMAVQTSRSGMQRMSTVLARYSARTARSPLAHHRYCVVGIGILLVRDVCSMHGTAHSSPTLPLALRCVLLHLDDPTSKARRLRNCRGVSGARQRRVDDTLCPEVQAGCISRAQSPPWIRAIEVMTCIDCTDHLHFCRAI